MELIIVIWYLKLPKLNGTIYFYLVLKNYLTKGQALPDFLLFSFVFLRYPKT